MIRARALVVRGGWDGHHPQEATDLFLPYLSERYQVRVEDSPEVYADAEAMAGIDLIVQCMTMSSATHEQVQGLMAAVTAGTGMVGWHGGIADSYRNSSDYLHLIGGQFATHPADASGSTMVPYTVEFTDAAREHPITAGLADFELTTEQYWVLTDDLIDVLATTTHPVAAHQPWHRPVTCPAVWTRTWGKGRIVVATPGHSLDVVTHPSVRTIIERGMLWATRTA